MCLKGVFQNLQKTPPTAWDCVTIKNEPVLATTVAAVSAPPELWCLMVVPQQWCHICRLCYHDKITGLSSHYALLMQSQAIGFFLKISENPFNTQHRM